MGTSMPLGAGAICVLMALSGCGLTGSSESDELVEASRKDMQAVTALTMNASIKQAGKPTKLRISMDLENDCKVTMHTGGGTAEIVVIRGKKGFLKADAAYYKSTGAKDPAVLNLVAGKWVEYDAKQAAEMCGLEDFLDEFDEETEDSSAGDGKETKVNGRAATKFTEENDDETSTIWVATGADNHVLKIETVGGDEPGTFTFSDYNKDVKVAKPAKFVRIPQR